MSKISTSSHTNLKSEKENSDRIITVLQKGYIAIENRFD